MTRPNPTRRGGATAVELAVVLPVLCLLVIAFIVGGLTVFNHEQAACLAREGARWASARGADYQHDTNLDSPTRQQIVDQAIRPLAAGMDPAALDVQVQWVNKGSGAVQDWDASSKSVRSVTPAGEYVSNAVRVTVTYSTASVFGEPLAVRSVCEQAMTN